MKNVKSLMLIGLLMTASVVVKGTFEDDYKFIKKELEKEAKERIAQLEEKRKNGTPSEKSAIATTDLVVTAIPAIVSMGLCTYVVDTSLNSFSVLKDMPNKGAVATGACASLYAALYAGYKYEEMKKTEAQQNSLYGWFASWSK